MAICTEYMELKSQSSAESFTPHAPFNNVAYTFFPKNKFFKLSYTIY